MALYQELVDFDLLFSQLRRPPLIINELAASTEEERLRVRDMITTQYATDMLSTIPTCSCGETRGEFNKHVICPECQTEVRSIIDDDIEPFVWFRKPQGIHKLINPNIWTQLRKRFTKSGFSVIQWICDTGYKPKVRQPAVIDELIQIGIQRGFNYFVDNFDYIFQTLLQLKDFRAKKGKEDRIADMIRDHRNILFCDFLPLPNRSILIIEKTNVGIYVDQTIVGAIDAIDMLTAIDSPIFELSLRSKEQRTVRALTMLSEFYENFQRKNLSGKPGIYRKHVFGGRTHFSFRAVVSSLTEPHAYDEIHVPWNVGVSAFRPHLVNKLMRRGYGHNAAVSLLFAHTNKFHPLINTLFLELLDESVEKSFITLEQRNPSLKQGSAQRKRITKIKPNVSDLTVSTSILTVKAPNTDQVKGN